MKRQERIERERIERQPESTDQRTPAERKRDRKHKGAIAGALLGTVSIGPLGAPIGAAAGAVADALAPDPNEPPGHTHDLNAPCYDGCPAWRSDNRGRGQGR